MLDLNEQVIRAVTEVFETMLSMKIEPSDDPVSGDLCGQRVVGSIGFAGEVMGNVSIQTEAKFSRLITACMLSKSPNAAVSVEEINDVIGELSSMIGGNLKSKICDAGVACELSFPSITTGEDFKIEHMSWDRHERFIFRYHQYSTLVDVRIKMLSYVPEETSTMDENKTSFIDIEKFVTTAAEEVFDMMLSMEISPCQIGEVQEEGDRIVGAVSFAGDVTGNVSVQVSRPFGALITANMLGVDIDELDGDEEVNDAVGELSNMIGGNLKSRFCDTGFPCELSIPSVTTGSDFKIENLGWTRHEQYAFKHQHYTTLVEVCMKLEK